MGALRTVPWKRAGLGSAGSDGEDLVGWSDLLAARGAGDGMPDGRPVRVADPVGTVGDEEWEDLARHRPGERVRLLDGVRRSVGRIPAAVPSDGDDRPGSRILPVGTDAPVRVGALLAGLPRTWRTLHAVPVGRHRTEIDHLVIGPGGVVAVSARLHPGAVVRVAGDTLRVDGERTRYVERARHDADRASVLLGTAERRAVSARGVVAVVGARKGVRVRRQPADGVVTVLDDVDLTTWIKDLPPTLDGPAVERLYERARRSTTWRS